MKAFFESKILSKVPDIHGFFERAECGKDYRMSWREVHARLYWRIFGELPASWPPPQADDGVIVEMDGKR